MVFNFAIINICVREIERLKQSLLWNNTRKLYVNYWKQSNLVNIYCVLSRLRNYIKDSCASRSRKNRKNIDFVIFIE